MSENTTLGFATVDAQGNLYKVIENNQKKSIYTISAAGELVEIKYCLPDGAAVIKHDEKNYEIIQTGKKLKRIDVCDFAENF